MIGHEKLFAMRRRGVRPVAVWVDDSDSPLIRDMAREWHLSVFGARPMFGQIVLAHSDVPEVVDWRCIVGMEVHVSSDRSISRCARIFDAVKAAQPLVVAAVIDGQVQIYRRP